MFFALSSVHPRFPFSPTSQARPAPLSRARPMVDLAGRRRLAVDPGLPTALTKTPFSSRTLFPSPPLLPTPRRHADSVLLAQVPQEGRRCVRANSHDLPFLAGTRKRNGVARAHREGKRKRERDRGVILAISISLKRDDLRYRRDGRKSPFISISRYISFSRERYSVLLKKLQVHIHTRFSLSLFLSVALFAAEF